MKRLLVGCLLFAVGVAVRGVEIPVHRGGSSSASVGYVDMELVFREYPEAKKAREEYQKEMVRQKGELADREKELADLKREIEKLKAASPSPAVEPSSAAVTAESVAVSTVAAQTPAAAPAAAEWAEGIATREAQLLKRQKELEEARESSAKSLREFEASRAKTILGRLYKALVELANERGIRLVVDKSAILYGENTIDLTEALNRRVRGLPEEQP